LEYPENMTEWTDLALLFLVIVGVPSVVGCIAWVQLSLQKMAEQWSFERDKEK